MAHTRLGLANGSVVEILDLGGPFGDGFVSRNQWPCLGCGQRRSVAEARTVVVQDLDGPPMARHILVCQECLDGRLPAVPGQPAAS